MVLVHVAELVLGGIDSQPLDEAVIRLRVGIVS